MNAETIYMKQPKMDSAGYSYNHQRKRLSISEWEARNGLKGVYLQRVGGRKGRGRMI